MMKTMMMRMICIMGIMMRMIMGMVSVWYRARQKQTPIKDTYSKIQKKLRFFCWFPPASVFRNPGPRQFLSLSQCLLLNQTERSLSGNFIDRKDKQQGVLPLWVPMSDARFADSKKINVIFLPLPHNHHVL